MVVPSSSSSDQSTPLLPLSSVPAQVWRRQLAAARRVVGLVAGGGGRVLHDHQAYGRLAGRRRRVVGGVLLGGVFAPAVVQDAGDEEDQEQDDIAGDQDDEVQGDGVNLQVKFHETHGAASYLARIQTRRKRWENQPKKSNGKREIIGVEREEDKTDG